MHNIKNLSNGIRVIFEKIPYVRSVSVGVWVGNGSANEKKCENGMSHFIEHMLFKGTGKRDARAIAYEIDAIGGQINAFTTREYTCYYTKTLDEHIDIALDVLSDMYYSPALEEASMTLERNVIVEEINMYEDEPDELAADLIMEAAYGDSAIGRSILGTRDSLSGINPENMRAYMKSHYTSKNTVIAISGNFNDSLFDSLEKYFASKEICNNSVAIEKCIYHPKQNIVRTKDCEQVQLIAGFKSINVKDDRVYSLLAFNNIFGSGMSSRLFQNIREQQGLAYSVYAYHAAYINTGIFNICAGMMSQNVNKVCDIIVKEIKRIKKDGLSSDELTMAKEQLKGNYILSYESIGARMQAAGRNLLLDKEMLSPEEVIDKINTISKDSVNDIIDTVLDTDTLCIAAVGAIDSVDNLFQF